MAKLENPNVMAKLISFLSSLLELVADLNDNNRKLQPQKIFVFHGLTRLIVSIQSYLERIFKYANCSHSCFIVAYVYLDWFSHQQLGLLINSFNVHRLLIAGVLVATKFMDDINYLSRKFIDVCYNLETEASVDFSNSSTTGQAFLGALQLGSA